MVSTHVHAHMHMHSSTCTAVVYAAAARGDAVVRERHTSPREEGAGLKCFYKFFVRSCFPQARRAAEARQEAWRKEASHEHFARI